MEKEYFSISDMAELHGLTRRTLLYYDKIGIFKPDHICENGYRYYSTYQIPILRELCFLRKLDFSLEEIQDYFQHRTPQMAAKALMEKSSDLDSEIKKLQKTKESIHQRMELFDHMESKYRDVDMPYIRWYPERKVIFQPFETEEMDKSKLHQTLMKAWQQVFQNDIMPTRGFGAIIRTESIYTDTPLKGAGSIINLSMEDEIDQDNLITLPEGEYVTMYKYGMPYDCAKAKSLIEWIKEKGYHIQGDIIDMCLLDTTFYCEEHKEDFCMLQIPIGTNIENRTN